jgi:ATP-binding cassette subfamily C protein
MLLVGGLLSLATTATGLALPLVVRELIERLAGHGSITTLLEMMIVLVLANAVIGAAGSHVLQRTAESVVLAARRQLVGRLVRLRMSTIERTEPGDLISRVTGDTTLLSEVVTVSLVSGVSGAIALFATLIMMGVLDVPLLGVTLAALLVAVVVVGYLIPRIHTAARNAQDSVGLMGAALERLFGAFRTVKASTAEGREQARVDTAAAHAWRANVRASIWSAVAGNTAGLTIQAAFLAVLSVGGLRVASGAIDVGTLVAFLLYIYYLMSPMQSIAGAVTQFQHGAAAIGRIQQAEALPVERPVAASPPMRTAPLAPVGVQFEHVSFRYAPELPLVLDDVSFALPPMGMTALVGPSGAGKTTILSLVENFDDPAKGRVLVDDRDVRDWPLVELRSTIGYVEQDAPVLSGTLRENLLYGAPGATEAEVTEVLGLTHLDRFVAALPNGLDTQVGHRGMKLSGGERQRVAVARSLLRRPGVLLLDEATSQLDGRNEAALRDTVIAAARSTTVLVVAHRLSTIVLADRILVLDAGRVTSVGTHDELLAEGGLYAELATTQFLLGADRLSESST